MVKKYLYACMGVRVSRTNHAFVEKRYLEEFPNNPKPITVTDLSALCLKNSARDAGRMLEEYVRDDGSSSYTWCIIAVAVNY